MYAAVAILAALRESERTGRGRYLDIGMMDSAMSWLVMTAAELAAGDRGVRGKLPLTGRYPCYNVYRTKDGSEVTLAALEEKFWRDFCGAAGRPDLIGRQFEQSPEVLAELRALFAGRTAMEWESLAKDGDFCLELVLTLEEALLDPQVRHRDLVRRTSVGGESYLELGNPLRRLQKGELGEAPEHGEHTLALLRELGYSEDELIELERSGLIRGRR
jgi:crotonobetainyl-CoA:carnitine CoA-transferase CaiB-like acyl-CoA transferase